MTNNNDAASIPHDAPEREVATDILEEVSLSHLCFFS